MVTPRKRETKGAGRRPDPPPDSLDVGEPDRDELAVAPPTAFDVTRLLVLTAEDKRLLAAWGAVAGAAPPARPFLLARILGAPEAAVVRRVEALAVLGALGPDGRLPDAVRALLAVEAKALLEADAKKKG